MAFGISAVAQEAYLSREAYRDRVEAYSQILKQQRLKATASTETRKIAQTGFLPKIDITAEGTANLNRLDAWNSPAGQYRPYTYQALATLGQPLYTGGSLIAQKNIAKADEELDKLAVELTLDPDTLSERCRLLERFGSISHARSRSPFRGYHQPAVQHHPRQV